MTDELITCEIRIDKATAHYNSDSLMTIYEIIMPFRLQSIMKAIL